MFAFVRAVARRIGIYELVAFATGFVLLAFELAASRILAPSIGTSTYIWTSVIGTMIAALAGGYAAGGWLADKRNRRTDIAWLLLLSALAIAGTGLSYQTVLSGVIPVLGDSRLQALLAAGILFAPASFLLGMVSPYLAKLRVQSTQTTGRSVAGLSAANSLGGITGTFCTGFIFFTIMGLRETLLLLVGILIICSWIMAMCTRRRAHLIMTAVLLSMAALQFALPVHAGVVADIDTPTSHYRILDGRQGDKPIRVIVTGPGGLQSGVYLQGSRDLVFGYTRKMADLVAAVPHKDRILILGGGAFSLPEYLGTHYPKSQIDVVEIDPQLPAIAARYFGYQQPPNVRVFAEDARTYLSHPAAAYDIILVDAYNDTSLPFTLTTTEYTALLKHALQPDGAAIVNIIGAANSACGPLLHSLYSSYVSAFDRQLLFPLVDSAMQRKQNIIGLFSNSSLDWANQVAGGRAATLPTTPPLTDDHAPVEYLNDMCQG